MRRAVVLPTILAFIWASILAPYQHVHLHSAAGHPLHANHDHHDDATVHIHPYSFAVPNGLTGGTSVGDILGGHVAIPLDTFATLSHSTVPTLSKPRTQMLLFPPEEAIAESVRVIEPRGHDPPDLDLSPPRAPPA